MADWAGKHPQESIIEVSQYLNISQFSAILRLRSRKELLQGY